MLTAESNRRGHMPGCVDRAIAAHIRWLRKQLAEFDATLEEAIRRSPMWALTRTSELTVDRVVDFAGLMSRGGVLC
jgi:hypothetical protein